MHCEPLKQRSSEQVVSRPATLFSSVLNMYVTVCVYTISWQVHGGLRLSLEICIKLKEKLIKKTKIYKAKQNENKLLWKSEVKRVENPHLAKKWNSEWNQIETKPNWT